MVVISQVRGLYGAQPDSLSLDHAFRLSALTPKGRSTDRELKSAYSPKGFVRSGRGFNPAWSGTPQMASIVKQKYAITVGPDPHQAERGVIKGERPPPVALSNT